MTARSTYLMQLIGRLHVAGVDGTDIGDLIAELSGHLDEIGADPIDEFGPVQSLATELIEQKRVRRLTWLRRVGLPWLAVPIGAAGLTALFAENVGRGALLSVRTFAQAITFLFATIVGAVVMARRRQGTTWLPPAGLSATLAIAVGGYLASSAIDPDVGISISQPGRWLLVVVAALLFLATLLGARNPIRYPDGFDSEGIERGPIGHQLRTR